MPATAIFQRGYIFMVDDKSVHHRIGLTQSWVTYKVSECCCKTTGQIVAFIVDSVGGQLIAV